MTEEEREELIEKMAKAAWPSDAAIIWDACPILLKQKHLNNARAALAVAELVIRGQVGIALREENARLREALEQSANELIERCDMISRNEAVKIIKRAAAAAIREGGKDA
jgi:hypothetical protein